MAQFNVVFAEVENTFDIGFDCVNLFTATMDTVVYVLPDPYIGEYGVTPRMYEQSLHTNGKQMLDDVTVYEIPVTYTTNIQGGKTALIG